MMKRKLIIAGNVLAGIVVAYLIFANISQYVAHNRGETTITPIDLTIFAPPPPPMMLYGINIDSMDVEEGVIQGNENLSEILARYNITAQTGYEISKLPRDSFDVRRLQTKSPI